MEFESVLPRLVAAYQRGQLVPFLGAGMSHPACPTWEPFIENLEHEAFGAAEARRRKKKGKSSDALIRRANSAVAVLRLDGSTRLIEAVRNALGRGVEQTLPKQVEALAQMYWPLVLTTNYDDLFVECWNAEHHTEARMEIRGRSSADCQRILASLHSPATPCLWTLQGFLPGSYEQSLSKWRHLLRSAFGIVRTRAPLVAPQRIARSAVPPKPSKRFFSFTKVDRVRDELRHFQQLQDAKHAELSRQLVVGHQEYRRVTWAEPQFRRAFAEVFRSRSLFFLGSGLAEQYLLNLFSEVLEIYGPNPLPHYALMRKGEVSDPEFLRSRFNIFVIEFTDFAELPKWLRRLGDEVERLRSKVLGWSYSLASGGLRTPLGSLRLPRIGDERALDLARGQLPKPSRKECIVVHAHDLDGDRPRLGSEQQQLVGELAGDTPVEELEVDKGELVARYRGLPVFAVTTSAHSSQYAPESATGSLGLHALFDRAFDHDLRSVGRAVQELLAMVDPEEFDRIRMPLLRMRDSWICPPRFVLTETIRAFGRWYREPQQRRRVPLTIHIHDPGALFDLTTGRIDPIQLLTCDEFVFWLEVELEDGVTHREPVPSSPGLGVLEIARQRGIDPTRTGRWHVEVEPAPLGYTFAVALEQLGDDPRDTLEGLGVVPGSTVRFFRAPASMADASDGTPRKTSGSRKASGASKASATAKSASTRKASTKRKTSGSGKRKTSGTTKSSRTGKRSGSRKPSGGRKTKGPSRSKKKTSKPSSGR